MERVLGHFAPATFRRRRTGGVGQAAFLMAGLFSPSRMTFHLSRVSKRLFESLMGTGFESLFWFEGAPPWGTKAHQNKLFLRDGFTLATHAP